MLKRPGQLKITFPMLFQNIFLVFLAKSTLIICCIIIARLEISMTLGFAITEYKVEETLFQMAIFDLYTNTKLRDKSLYKRFYFTYTQLLFL